MSQENYFIKDIVLLHNNEGNSDKYYMVCKSELGTVISFFGRRGKKGSLATRNNGFQSLIDSKIKKGYVKIADETSMMYCSQEEKENIKKLVGNNINWFNYRTFLMAVGEKETYLVDTDMEDIHIKKGHEYITSFSFGLCESPTMLIFYQNMILEVSFENLSIVDNYLYQDVNKSIKLSEIPIEEHDELDELFSN